MKLTDADKSVPQNAALSIIAIEGRKRKLPRKRIQAAQAYISSLPTDKDMQIRWDVLSGALANAMKALRDGEPEHLTQRRGFKVQKVPDVQEVTESKEYANKKSIIWPAVIENLQWIHHGTPDVLPRGIYRKRPDKPGPPCIISLSGAQGGGKSQTTYLSAFYTLVLLFMMHDPHLEFGHDPTSWIIFMFQSLKEKTGRDSLFDKLKNTIDQSPWFEKHAPRNKKLNEELQWPDKMIKVMNLTGEWDSALGKDIFWAGINEINEMRVIEHSKRTADTSQIKFDVGQRMWDNVANRLETRFSQAEGGFPGKLIADSARAHTNDFTSRLKELAKTDSNILVIERTLWEAKAHEYSPDEKRFFVELGDDQRPPRIIETLTQAIDKNRVVRVPWRHRARFESDCENACKYFIGEPTRSVGRFIPYPEKITRAHEAYVEKFGDSRPFKLFQVSFRDLFGEIKEGEGLDWSGLIDQAWFDNLLDKPDSWTMHVDMASTQCDAGFAFGCIIDTKVVANALYWDPGPRMVKEYETAEAPVYLVAGILAIHANPGEIIDPGIVQALGLEIKRLIGPARWWGSSDWFESQQMLAAWRRAGIIADKYSVDKKPDGYFEYLHGLRDERLLLMPHPKNDEETRSLKRNIKGGKIAVTKPEGGSKDLADSCGGVLGVLGATEALRYYREVDGGKSSDLPDTQFGSSDLDEDEDIPTIGKAWKTRGGRGRKIL